MTPALQEEYAALEREIALETDAAEQKKKREARKAEAQHYFRQSTAAIRQAERDVESAERDIARAHADRLALAKLASAAAELPPGLLSSQPVTSEITGHSGFAPVHDVRVHIGGLLGRAIDQCDKRAEDAASAKEAAEDRLDTLRRGIKQHVDALAAIKREEEAAKK